jgi:hypothetical protein
MWRRAIVAAAMTGARARLMATAQAVAATASAAPSAASIIGNAVGLGASAPSGTEEVSLSFDCFEVEGDDSWAPASPRPAVSPLTSTPTPSPPAQPKRIEVVVRTKVGSKNSQWARQNGYVPGMIYGGKGGSKGAAGGAGNIVLTYSKEDDLRKEIARRRLSFLNTLYTM